MTAPTLDADPACPGADPAATRTPAAATPAATRSATSSTPIPTSTALRAERRPVDMIPRATWDALAARNPWSTPFSSWAFHRAWWDGFGANAHDETLVIVPADAPADGSAEPVAIVPLMHRHEVEPSDAQTRTRMRHGTDGELIPVAPDATAIFFGATYHADYATVLAAPADLPRVADAVADHVASLSAARWDVVDLRRLRCGDPAAGALATAFGARAAGNGWTLDVEREDVCPVVTVPVGLDIDAYLATLGKKERHEIRRKIRRAEAVGEIRLTDSDDPIAHLDAFIDLHQKRWGSDGLFPPTPGGEQSRIFFRRLFELFGADTSADTSADTDAHANPLRLTFLTVGGRCIAAGIHFETPDAYLYYNAGVDPDARELSPGVLMAYAYLRRAIDAGVPRLDFLRGDESYKYEWGARDEPIQRILLRRRAG